MADTGTAPRACSDPRPEAVATGARGVDRYLSGLTELWSLTLGDPRICVAVLDGPVDFGHPCFEGANLKQSRVWPRRAKVRGCRCVMGPT